MIFPRKRALGLIFKKEDLWETSKIFSVYTREFGKIKVLGRGIRKISSKLKSMVEIFSLSEIEFVEGRKNRILTDALNLIRFENLKKDLKKLSIAYKISEILEGLIKGEEKDEKIWNLVLSTFENLNNPNFQCKLSKKQYYYFLWNLISLLGHKPELHFCVICQKKIRPGKIYFSEKEGGLICQDCFLKTKQGQRISVGTVKVLRAILREKFEYFAKLKMKKEIIEDLEKTSETYLNFLVEKNQNNEDKVF